MQLRKLFNRTEYRLKEPRRTEFQDTVRLSDAELQSIAKEAVEAAFYDPAQAELDRRTAEIHKLSAVDLHARAVETGVRALQLRSMVGEREQRQATGLMLEANWLGQLALFAKLEEASYGVDRV